MQPCSREMNQDLLNNHLQIQPSHFLPLPTSHHFDPSSSHDDFLEQMFSTVPSSTWPDLNPAINSAITGGCGKLRDLADETPPSNPENAAFPYDESVNLASKLRSHQISGGSSDAKAAAMMLQQHLLMSRGVTGAGDNNSLGLLPMPLSLEPTENEVVDVLSTFKSQNPGGDQALYNGFAAQTLNHQQHFHQPNSQNYGASGSAMNQIPPGGSAGAPATQPRQRVRARRGQATDPHSIAERLRRERIAERMKALQELVPNANKTDKASMLDEIIDYVKFLQLQVKVLSMSRLGGAPAVASLVADMSSEGGGIGGGRGDCVPTPGRPGGPKSAPSNDSLALTEHQVAKMMEEDMGSAMQYLQGKGLCLMPISLATAISTATCHSKNPLIKGPSSPNMSALTVQSASLVNAATTDLAVKEAASTSKPSDLDKVYENKAA